MKRGAFFAIISIFCLIAQPLFAEVISGTDAEVKAIASPILDTLIKGLQTNDYAKYSSQLDPTNKEIMPENKFIQANAQIENKMGECISREYLGFLNQSNMTVVLFKARFSKINDDVLAKLVISKIGGKYFATGLWFQ